MVEGNKKSSGVAAVEFALIFPIIFMMLYAILTYSLIFALQHSLSLAAAEGGRAAVRYISQTDELKARKKAACAEIVKSLGWLAAMKGNLSCDEGGGGGGGVTISFSGNSCGIGLAENECVALNINYDYDKNPLIPKIPFFVPVPKKLSAQSFTRISFSF